MGATYKDILPDSTFSFDFEWTAEGLHLKSKTDRLEFTIPMSDDESQHTAHFMYQLWVNGYNSGHDVAEYENGS